MKLRYFIDYVLNDAEERFIPIGIWVQNMDDLGADIFYQDDESDEYWDAIWVINRLIRSGSFPPPLGFLEYHQGQAGYKGMRSRIFEEETDIGYDQFMRKTLQRFIAGEG